MRFLLLTPQIPYPPRQGASLRNYYIVRGLAQMGQVTLLTFREENQTSDPAVLAPLLECATTHCIPAPARTTTTRLWQLVSSTWPDMAHRLYCPTFAQKLEQLLQNNPFDVVQIEGLELACYIPLIQQTSPRSKIVFDNHNAETALQKRAMQTDLKHPGRWLAALYSAVQVVKLYWFERWACQTAAAVTVVSETDAQILQKVMPNKRPVVIPNCIDVQAYDRLPYDSHVAYDLVFTGKMDYRPNVDAILWFTEAVWPLIKSQHPDTTLAIVGQKPHDSLQSLADWPGITLTGLVDDVRPYLAGAKIIVMPLRMGSGTRLKFIEACAAGKGIVTTRIGAEGFEISSGREAFVADDPAGFAQAVVHLLSNPEEGKKLGECARAFARPYDWREVIPKFMTIYQNL